MSRPSPLTQADQEKLIQQIGVALLRVVPVEWQRILIEYRAAGKHIEMSAEVLAADGTTLNWAAPRECAQLFGRLRSGMFEEDRGTWQRSRYLIKQPSSYAIGFDYEEEPRWQNPPPPIAFVDELRFFPRPEDKIPEWMAERVKAAGATPQAAPVPAPTSPFFRLAKVFDGVDADGVPIAEREPVSGVDGPKLVEYLQRAPVVFSSRGMDTDKLSADQAPVVPMTFHTDGVWVWSAAVWFYLLRHNIPPEPALLEHIRERGFALAQVDEPTRRAAAATLVPPPRPVPPANPNTGGHAVIDGGAERPAPERNGKTNGHVAPVGTPLPERQEDPQRELDNAALDVLRHRLAELQVPPGSFRINEVDDRAWCLIRVPEANENAWSVFWSESGERHNEVTFGKVAEASAYLLGALLLAPIPQDN